MPTTCGSPIYRDHVVGKDAACVAQLVKAGAVVLGKAVTTEFAGGHAAADPPSQAPRIGLIRTPWWDVAEPYNRKNIEEAARTLRAAGAAGCRPGAAAAAPAAGAGRVAPGGSLASASDQERQREEAQPPVEGARPDTSRQQGGSHDAREANGNWRAASCRCFDPPGMIPAGLLLLKQSGSRASCGPD